MQFDYHDFIFVMYVYSHIDGGVPYNIWEEEMWINHRRTFFEM